MSANATVEALSFAAGRHEFEVCVEGPNAALAALDLLDRGHRVGESLDPVTSTTRPDEALGAHAAVAWANHEGDGEFTGTSVVETERTNATETTE